MIPFWPFRKPKSKLEIWQDAASDLFSHTVAGVQHTIEALPLDRAAESLKHSSKSAAQTLGHASSSAASALSSTVASAKDVATNAVANVAENPAAKSVAAKIADARDFWHDKTDDLKDNAQNASQHANEAAHDAARNVQRHAADIADKTRETAKAARAQVQEKLEATPKADAQSVEAAHEKAQAAREHAAELAALAAAALAEWKKQAVKKAQKEAAFAQNAAHKAAADIARQAKRGAQAGEAAARDLAARSSTRFADAHDALASHFDDASKNTKKQTSHETRLSNDEMSALKTIEVPQHEDATSKWLWIAVGVLAGAALMVFLAPNTGRRSRALAQDKLRKASRKAAQLRAEASSKAADLRNKAEGKLHEAQSANSEDFADEVTIADRVRTALGEAEATRNMERINVDCADGVVTLRGPMIDEELKTQIELLVQGVKGVREVRSQFLIDDSTNDDSTNDNSSDEVFVG